jgi:hypothetical protein
VTSQREGGIAEWQRLLSICNQHDEGHAKHGLSFAGHLYKAGLGILPTSEDSEQDSEQDIPSADVGTDNGGRFAGELAPSPVGGSVGLIDLIIGSLVLSYHWCFCSYS